MCQHLEGLVQDAPQGHIEAEILNYSILFVAFSNQLVVQADTGSVLSDYASDASETTSTTPSMFNYEYENGRRYHAYRAGQYLLPNDEKEQERLDMTHHVFLLALKGALCATQLESPQSILDIGTGTGL